MLRAAQFCVDHSVLHYMDPKAGSPGRVVVDVRPLLREQAVQYLQRIWWWDTMYRDSLEFARNCAECTVVRASGKLQQPPLHPIRGGAGGLEAQVTTNDQKKWDGMGSPPGAVGKSGTPPTINTAD